MKNRVDRGVLQLRVLLHHELKPIFPNEKLPETYPRADSPVTIKDTLQPGMALTMDVTNTLNPEENTGLGLMATIARAPL